jgi:hypothetical protein
MKKNVSTKEARNSCCFIFNIKRNEANQSKKEGTHRETKQEKLTQLILILDVILENVVRYHYLHYPH